MFRYSKKEALICGCSMVADYVTFKNRLFDRGFKKYLGVDEYTQDKKLIEWEKQEPWPTPIDTISKEFDMKPMNLSFPGSGNLQIYEKLADYIITNYKHIGLVVACWTSFARLDYETAWTNVYGNKYQTMRFYNYDIDSPQNESYLNKKIDFWKELHRQGQIFYQKDIDMFYRNSIALDAICKNFGIELIQAKSILTYPFSKNQLYYYLNHPMYSQINKINFYGWPCYFELGGKPLIHDINENTINKNDKHPNANGHQKMAQLLIDLIKDRGIM